MNPSLPNRNAVPGTFQRAFSFAVAASLLLGWFMIGCDNPPQTPNRGSHLGGPADSSPVMISNPPVKRDLPSNSSKVTMKTRKSPDQWRTEMLQEFVEQLSEEIGDHEMLLFASGSPRDFKIAVPKDVVKKLLSEIRTDGMLVPIPVEPIRAEPLAYFASGVITLELHNGVLNVNQKGRFTGVACASRDVAKLADSFLTPLKELKDLENALSKYLIEK